MKNLKTLGAAFGIAALVLILAGCGSHCPPGSEYNSSNLMCEYPMLMCNSVGVCREHDPDAPNQPQIRYN
ncbi:MAG: hypothetical protein ACR2PJ_00660 [Pseudomonadales bacterium]